MEVELPLSGQENFDEIDKAKTAGAHDTVDGQTTAKKLKGDDDPETGKPGPDDVPEEELVYPKDDIIKGFKTLQNYLSGAVVAMVALCLSIGLAIASGATPMMGLQAAVYGPAIAGFVGGSSYQVMGPAGALISVLNKMAHKYTVAVIPLCALFGGIIEFLMVFITGHHYFDDM